MLGSITLLVILLLNLKKAESSTATGHDTVWGYDGAIGPDSWPEICEEGQRQSPIKIDLAHIRVANLPPLNYVGYDHLGDVVLTNNGHSVATSGYDKWQTPPYITGGGFDGKYNLIGLHFHWGHFDNNGSEHTFDGLHFPLEAHFVHLKDGLSADEALLVHDGMAVLSVFFSRDTNGEPLVQFQDAFRLSDAFGTTFNVSNVLLKDMIPETKSFYRYNGSLTTPDCNEAVVWTIMAEPLTVTELQLSYLRQHLSTSGRILHNNRPLQKLNGRPVLFRSELPTVSNNLQTLIPLNNAQYVGFHLSTVVFTAVVSSIIRF